MENENKVEVAKKSPKKVVQSTGVSVKFYAWKPEIDTISYTYGGKVLTTTPGKVIKLDIDKLDFFGKEVKLVMAALGAKLDKVSSPWELVYSNRFSRSLRVVPKGKPSTPLVTHNFNDGINTLVYNKASTVLFSTIDKEVQGLPRKQVHGENWVKVTVNKELVKKATTAALSLMGIKG